MWHEVKGGITTLHFLVVYPLSIDVGIIEDGKRLAPTVCIQLVYLLEQVSF